jgi:pimeloyl-ACP methyl ester carboxylesterase
MSTATIAGHDLFYERSGAGEPLLLIMGMSGTRTSWGEPFLDALRTDFDVLVYDHRGVGGSSPTSEPFSIADLAQDASALLDAVGWDSAHVVGISMGGMIAQELAIARPEQVRTLTLGCTYAGGEGSALAPDTTLAHLGAAWQSGDRDQAIRAGWEVNVSEAFAGDDEAFAAFRARAMELPVALAVIMLQMQAIGAHDTSARLAQISAPTLVVHGTEDIMLPVVNAPLIAQAIPDSRLTILEGIGHLFFVEQPQESAQLIREHALAGTTA